MSGSEDCLFVWQPFLSPFVEIGPEDIIVDNNLRCHEPDHSPQMSVPPFTDSTLSLVFTRLIG